MPTRDGINRRQVLQFVGPAADQWCAVTADTIMEAGQRWRAWNEFLQQWPELRALQVASEEYETGGWILERLTAKSIPNPMSKTPDAADYLWELLLSRENQRAVVQARITLHWAPDSGVDGFKPGRISLVNVARNLPDVGAAPRGRPGGRLSCGW